MKHIIILLGICLPITLQEAYDQAGPYNEYEKYLVLEPNQTYTGGIGIYEGDTYIDCRGSIIDLDYQNGIWIYADENYLSSLMFKLNYYSSKRNNKFIIVLQKINF